MFYGLQHSDASWATTTLILTTSTDCNIWIYPLLYDLAGSRLKCAMIKLAKRDPQAQIILEGGGGY